MFFTFFKFLFDASQFLYINDVSFFELRKKIDKISYDLWNDKYKEGNIDGKWHE